MKTNIHRTLKLIGSMLLVMVMSITMVGYVPQVVQAEGGTATVTLSKVDGLDPSTEFNFELYKVGHFEGPDFVLDDNLKGSNADVKFPSNSEESDQSRAERMLASASQLTKYIDDNKISLKAIGGTHTLKPGGSFSEAVSENGLYLVRSNTVRDASGGNFNWTPQPVYLMILNGDSSIDIANTEIDGKAVVKIVRTPIQFKHRVKKTWTIPASAGNVKPGSIYVNIRYGGEIIDTVKLTGQSSWTYDWTSEEDGNQYKYIGHDVNGKETVKTFTPNTSKPYWSVDEILDSSKVTGWNLTADEKTEIDSLSKCFTPEYSNPKTVEVVGEGGKTETIEEHVINNPYHEPPTPPEKPSKKIKTGDYAHLMGWAAVLLTSCIVLVIVLFRRKKNR